MYYNIWLDLDTETVFTVKNHRRWSVSRQAGTDNFAIVLWRKLNWEWVPSSVVTTVASLEDGKQWIYNKIHEQKACPAFEWAWARDL